MQYFRFRSFRGRFSPYIYKYNVIDSKEYEKKKIKAFESFYKSDNQVESYTEQTLRENRNNILNAALESGVSKVKLAEIMGINQRTLLRWQHTGGRTPLDADKPTLI